MFVGKIYQVRKPARCHEVLWSYGPWVNSNFKNFNLVRSITQIVFIVRGYNILPKFVNQLIASSIQIIQIDSRHLLSYYMPIALVYYYTGVFCDIWTLLLFLNPAERFRLQWSEESTS